MPTPYHSSHEQRLDALQEGLHRVRMVTREIIDDVITGACLRLQAQHPDVKAGVLRLIDSRAYTDAILALLELELPQWRLRRLMHEEGEWHCTLSKQLGVPVELDDMAEGSHETLPLAMLSAFVEARRSRFVAATERRASHVPQLWPAWDYLVCCDNFR